MISIVTAEELDAEITSALAGLQRVSLANMPTVAARVASQFHLHCYPRSAKPLLLEIGVIVEHNHSQIGLDAWWERSDDRYFIHAPRLLDAESMSFVLWHEFFEIVYSTPSFPLRTTPEMQEKLADAFAENILMPVDEVRRQCVRLNHPAEDRTGTLKAHFGVSYELMKKRLKDLRLAPRYRR